MGSGQSPHAFARRHACEHFGQSAAANIVAGSTPCLIRETPVCLVRFGQEASEGLGAIPEQQFYIRQRQAGVMDAGPMVMQATFSVPHTLNHV